MARGAASRAPQTGGELARLLETEARLDGMLRGASEEAARLVQAARAARAGEEMALTTTLVAEGERLAGAIAAEQRRREAELAAAARREAARYDAITAPEVDRLARYLVSRVIGAEA